MTGASVFDDHLDAWQQEQESPWGRLRYSVVRHTLDRVVGQRVGLRVLDLGGGDAADSARFAEHHTVTVLDFSQPLLDRAAQREPRLKTLHGDLDEATGQWDLVLCHNVVQYRDDLAATLRHVAGLVAPDGYLSLMAPNPTGDVIASLVRQQDPRRARDLLDAADAHRPTFDLVVRRVSAEHTERLLRDHGMTTAARYGIRCANDLISDDSRKHDPDFWADLEALELALCDREPWIRTGRFWQLIFQREHGPQS